MLNREWVEFTVLGSERPLSGDRLSHRTHRSGTCQVTGMDDLWEFGSLHLKPGQSVRVHTGSGVPYWDGSLYHTFLGRGWYAWNNVCGDEAQLRFQQNLLDRATYQPNPREGILTRVSGTNVFQ